MKLLIVLVATVQIYAQDLSLKALSWDDTEYLIPTAALMIRFDYAQLPRRERQQLCRERLLTALSTDEWTDLADVRAIWLKYHTAGRYPSRTERKLREFLQFMEARQLVHLKVIPGTEIITHVRKVRHVPWRVQWRPRPRPKDV